MWSEHLDCKCVYRMCGRNVLQIGMYLSVELWVEAIFFIYIGSYIILFICLFVAMLLIIFLWVGSHNFLHLFVLWFFFCSTFFPVEGEQLMQQYSKTRLQPSDVKTPKPVIDASMPKVMYIVWTTFELLRLFWSVFVTEPVESAAEDWARSRLTLYKGCILHRPQSCAFFYAIEHRERETISWSLYWHADVDCLHIGICISSPLLNPDIYTCIYEINGQLSVNLKQSYFCSFIYIYI